MFNGRFGPGAEAVFIAKSSQRKPFTVKRLRCFGAKFGQFELFSSAKPPF